MLHLPGGAFSYQQTAIVLQVLLIEAREAASVQLIIRTFHRWLTMLRTNFITRYFTMLVMLLPERRNELTYSLRTRRHDRTPSQRVTRLTDNNFIIRQLLKEVISIYYLIIVFVRLVMFY